MSIWTRNRRVKHPEWIGEALESIEKAARLYREGKIPQSIEVPMLVVPMQRALRSVYGSNLQAAIELLRLALVGIKNAFWYSRVVPFWHLKVLRKTPEQWLKELDMEADEA